MSARAVVRFVALVAVSVSAFTAPAARVGVAHPQRWWTPVMTSTYAESCFLFDTEEGRKYVCTESPQELAWLMGVEESDLVAGPKPEDLELVECHEEWSHTGTPQWACKEDGVAPPAPAGKFQPLRRVRDMLSGGEKQK